MEREIHGIQDCYGRVPVPSEKRLSINCVRKAVEMRKFIEAAYARPVSPSAWRSFTDTLPIDKDFLRNSYEHMVKEGFLIACWAGMFQYGQPHFDAVALIANKTVDRQHVPNEPFHSEYKAVAKRIRATGSDLHDPEIK